MPRDTFYQSVGNPIQFDRLPSTQPTLAFAHRSVPMLVKPHFVKAVQWLAAATFAAWMMQMVATVYGLPLVIPVVCWPLTLGLIVFGGHGRLPVGAVMTLSSALLLGRTPLLTPLCAAAVLGCLTWHFTRHWSHLMTAAPLPDAVAQQLRRTWDVYLVVVVAIFVITVTGIAALDSAPLMVATLVGMPLVSVVYGFFTLTNVAAWRVSRDALLSWWTYHSSDRPIPGIAQSPAGTTQGRRLFVTLAAFAAAIAGHHWTHISGIFPYGLTAEVSLLAPLVVVWVPFGLAFPILLESARYHRTSIQPEDWPSLIDQVRSSSDDVEQQSLWLGNVVADGSPMLVPIQVFDAPSHFLGDTGSGKTSMGLAPFIEQRAGRGDCSVIFIDLKADTHEPLATLYQAAADGCKRSGNLIPVKHFTNQVGLSTFAFNPLTQKSWGQQTLAIRADLLSNALGLQYGTGYGESYFASANTAVLYEALKYRPDVHSFRELTSIIGDLIADRIATCDLHAEIRRAGLHVHEVVKRLASFEALNVVAGSRYEPAVVQQAIELSDVFSQPQMLYFHLSATIAPGASPDIARLVTNLLLTASTPAARKVPVYLIVDEFQRMTAQNVEAMLQLARSMGVSLVLANQTLQDLKEPGLDLTAVLEANCRYRQWFSVSSTADREMVMAISGQTIEDFFGTSTSQSGLNVTNTFSTKQELQPRLGPNDISLASDHPLRSIVRISRGDGYAQYGGMTVVVESNYHITPEEYRRRKEFAWPAGGPGTLIPKLDLAVPVVPPKAGPIITTETIG